MLVERGRIKTVTFFGDFFGEKDAKELAEKLRGVRYDQPSLREALKAVDTTQYFAEIDMDTFVQLLG